MKAAQPISTQMSEAFRPGDAPLPPTAEQTGHDTLRDCADVGVLRQRSVIFAALSDEEAEAVMRLSRIVRYPARKLVIQEGEAGDQLLILLRGRVKVGLNSPEGKEVTLGLLEPGDVIGEMALLDGEAPAPRSPPWRHAAFSRSRAGIFCRFWKARRASR